MTVPGLLLEWLVGAAAVAVIGAVVFGLVTGRLSWRTEGCCPADPSKDLRMRSTPVGPSRRGSKSPTGS